MTISTNRVYLRILGVCSQKESNHLLVLLLDKLKPRKLKRVAAVATLNALKCTASAFKLVMCVKIPAGVMTVQIGLHLRHCGTTLQ